MRKYGTYYFCKFLKKIIEKNFANNYEKRKYLDHYLSQRPNKPAYYIEDCQISSPEYETVKRTITAEFKPNNIQTTLFQKQNHRQ